MSGEDGEAQRGGHGGDREQPARSVIAWRSHGGKSYFIVFNNSDTAVNNAAITLKGVSSASTATVVGESRSVSLSNGSLTDSFAADSVHIYVVG